LALLAQLNACIMRGIPFIFCSGFLINLVEPILAGINIIVSEKFNFKAPLAF